MSTSGKVILKSNYSESFEVGEVVASESHTIKNTVEDSSSTMSTSDKIALEEALRIREEGMASWSFAAPLSLFADQRRSM